MKVASDELYRLIQSMSPGEKRYFSSNFLTTDNQQTKLFHFLNQLEEYSDVAVKQRFEGQMIAKNLKVYKNQLKERLLASLAFQSAKTNPVTAMHLEMMKLRVLQDKHLLTSALRKARKGLAQTRQFGLHALQLDFLDLEHKIIHQSGGLEIDLESKESLNAFEAALELNRFINDDILLRDSESINVHFDLLEMIYPSLFFSTSQQGCCQKMPRLNHFQRRQNRTVIDSLSLKRLSVELLKYYRDLQISGPEVAQLPDLHDLDRQYVNADPILQFVLDFRVSSCRFLQFCAARDWDAAFEHSEKMLHLTRHFPDHQLSTYNYMSVVANYISLAIRIGKEDKLGELVAEAEQHCRKHPQFAASMLSIYTHQLSHYTAKRMFETVRFHSAGTIQFMEKFKRDSSILAAHIYCYIATAELALGNHSRAGEICQLIVKRKTATPKHCELFAAMAITTMHLESGSHRKLQRHIRSVEKRLNEDNSPFLQSFHDTILKMSKAIPAQQKMLVQELVEESNTLEADDALQVFQTYHLGECLMRYVAE